MQSNLSNYRAYTQATHTVAKTRQVVMLYDATIRNIQQAKDAIGAKRFDERFNLISKASEILMGLQTALDFEKGGAVSQTLYDFYGYLEMRIRGVHRTNDLAVCDEVLNELKNMRNVWNDIDQQAAPKPIEIDAAVLASAQLNDPQNAMAVNAITA